MLLGLRILVETLRKWTCEVLSLQTPSSEWGDLLRECVRDSGVRMPRLPALLKQKRRWRLGASRPSGLFGTAAGRRCDLEKELRVTGPLEREGPRCTTRPSDEEASPGCVGERSPKEIPGPCGGVAGSEPQGQTQRRARVILTDCL